MVENGEINPKFGETGELNARTGMGITAEGELVIVVVDGWDHFAPDQGATPPKGITLTRLAEILIEQGCHTGVDFDGGGSTTLAINGEVVNEPNDDGAPSQRAVINHLCLKLSELEGVEPVPDPPDPSPDPPDPPGDPIVEIDRVEGTYDGEPWVWERQA